MSCDTLSAVQEEVSSPDNSNEVLDEAAKAAMEERAEHRRGGGRRKRKRERRWYSSEDWMLVALRVDDGMHWDDIAQRLHRPVAEVQARFALINVHEQHPRHMEEEDEDGEAKPKQARAKVNRRAWTGVEDSRLLGMRCVDGKPWSDIAAALDRTVRSVRHRYNRIKGQ